MEIAVGNDHAGHEIKLVVLESWKNSSPPLLRMDGTRTGSIKYLSNNLTLK